MKKLLFTFIAAMLVFCGCNKTKQFEVAFNLNNADGQTLYLCKTVNGNDVVLDKAIVTNNQVVLTAPYDDPQTLYIVKFNENDRCGVYTFFSENQNIKVKGDRNDMPHWMAKGCPAMDELEAFHEKSLAQFEDPLMALNKEVMMAYEEGDTVRGAETNARIMPLFQAYLDNKVAFIKSHSDSFLGAYMLDMTKEELDLELVKTLAAGFTTESVFSKNVQEYIDNGGLSTGHACCVVE